MEGPRLQAVRIDLVLPGQVTALPVLNSAGGTLVGGGTTLSEAHIRRLKSAGVESIQVVGESQAAHAPVPPPARRLEMLAERFAGVEEPLLLEIKQLAAARLQSMLSDRAS